MGPTLSYLLGVADVRLWGREKSSGVETEREEKERECISVPVSKVSLFLIFSNETPARGSNHLLMFSVHSMPYIGQ